MQISPNATKSQQSFEIPPAWILVSLQFQCNSCVLCHILNMPTEFGDDRSNSNEMATDFRNSRWRRPPPWFLLNVRFGYDIRVWGHVFNISIEFSDDWSTSKEVATDFRNSRWQRPPSLVLVKCIFNVTVAFYVGLSSVPPNLVRIGAIVKKWQPIFEIKDGDHRHLEFW